MLAPPKRCNLNPKLARLLKEIQFRSPLRKYFFPRYLYNFTPPQLCFLCQCLEDTRHLAGSYAEIGCDHGATTVFLNKYMDAQNIPKTYYALDTFLGFVAADIAFEIALRGKTKDLFTSFQVNNKKWFDGTMRENHITRVHSITADVNHYDLRTLGPLSFILLDVDLYRPMKKCLPQLFEVLTPGGIIVVDDCVSSDIRWDGSDQAYKEFMRGKNHPPQIIHGKLGIVRKDA